MDEKILDGKLNRALMAEKEKKRSDTRSSWLAGGLAELIVGASIIAGCKVS